MSDSGTRRRHPILTVVLVVLIVAVPLGVFAWGRTSGTFRVRHIVLSGARPAHDKALDGALRRRFLGSNLFLVTTGRVRAALSGFPFVARVSVNRDFPGTLRVHMSEYVPAALLSSGGRWYVVSKEGRVLAAAVVKQPKAATSPGGSASPTTSTQPTTSTSTQPTTSTSTQPTTSTSTQPTDGVSPSTSASPSAGATSNPTAAPSPSSTAIPRPTVDVKLPRGTRRLPAIVSATPVAVGATVNDPHVRAALLVLGALPTALRRDVMGAGATDTSIRIYTAGGLTVEFGGAARLTAKVIALKAVLGRYHAHGVTCTFVDVSVPDRPLAAPVLSSGASQSVGGTTPTPGASSGTTSTSPTPSASGSPTSTP